MGGFYMKRRVFSLYLIVVMVCFTLSITTRAQSSDVIQVQYYVDNEGGDDGNNGLSIEQAFKTIEGARDAVRLVNGDMTGDIIINLKGGLYALDNPIELDNRDGGSNGFNVIYKNYNEEVPMLSGGEKIEGWELHDVTKNIYKATVETSVNFRQLYVDDDFAIRAREPNLEDQETKGPYFKAVSSNRDEGYLKVKNTDTGDWLQDDGVEMVLQAHWYHWRVRVGSFHSDSSYGYVYPKEEEQNYAFNKKNYFYKNAYYHYENAYDLLDDEGEWFLNEQERRIYYIPRAGQNIEELQVFAPKLEHLLLIQGEENEPVENLIVQGLTFKHSTWTKPNHVGAICTQAFQPTYGLDKNQGDFENRPSALVRVDYGKEIQMLDNTFTLSGGNGLEFYVGVQNSQISGNVTNQIAGIGINLDTFYKANPSETEQCKDIVVANNQMLHSGVIYNGAGFVGNFVRDITFQNNEIGYSSYSGLRMGMADGEAEVGTGDNLICYNYVHHVMTLHDDGGAIYTQAPQEGTQIFENYAHDVIRSPYAGSYAVAGVYLDNYSQNILVKDNYVEDVSAVTYEQVRHGAKDNTFINNGELGAAYNSIIVNAGLNEDWVKAEPIPVEPENKVYTWSLDNSLVESSGVIETHGVGAILYSDEAAVGTAAFRAHSQSYLDLSASVNLLPLGNQARTLAGWFNTEEDTNQSYIAYGKNSRGNRVSITANNDSVSVAVNGHKYGVSELGLQAGWHHVAVVLPEGATESDEWLIYIDGVLMQNLETLAGSKQTINTIGEWAYIGRSDNHFYEGLIDQVIICNYAMDENDILELYTITE